MKRVLVLVFDSASPALIDRWIDDGSLPNLKRLRANGAYGLLQSYADVFGESLPYALHTSLNPGQSGLYSFSMWDAEGMQLRPPGADWMPYRPFWRNFHESDPRAVILDPPNVYAPEPFHGVEIVGWASHDSLVPFQSYPAEIATAIDQRVGSGLMPDEMSGLPSRKQFSAERRRLLTVTPKFAELCVQLMRREPWDLFMATLTTAHDAGHRLWSTGNIRDSLESDEELRLRSALHEVYMACDTAIGKVIEAAGEDAIVIVMSPEGMGANNSRSWILPEMVQRVAERRQAASKRSVLSRLRERIPVEWRSALKARLPFQWRRQLTGFWRTTDYEWRNTRAFALLSITQGYVRINVKGREAQGIVEPGAEYESVCREISQGLMSFVDADTGEPLVLDVLRPRDVFHGDRLAYLPDLIVRWAPSPAARHRTIHSPQFGTIAWPTPGQNPDGRGGGHGGPGMLMVAGPQVKSGRIDNAHILDLAPTVLSLLGQQIPEQMEGKPLPLLK